MTTRSGLRPGSGAPPLAVLILLATACGGEAPRGDGPSATGVDAVVARLDTVEVEVRSVGSLEADQRVEMAAEAAGRVSSILFTEGSRVRAGQVLLRLEESKLSAEVQAVEATVARARREAENLERQVRRNRALLEAGAISPQTFDDLETAYDAATSRVEEAEARLALAGARLSDATIRAPFSGVVGVREVDVGEYVAAGDPLFTLVDDDPLEIEFQLPERYSDGLVTGREVRLRVASHPDRTFEGRVSFVSPVVDIDNRTVGLKAEVENPDRTLRPGQFADVVIGLDSRPDAVVVPEAAIVPRGGQTLVFLARGGTASRRQVEIGERVRGIVEIRSGISAGDTVIVAGQQRLGDGTPVAVRLREEGALETTSFSADSTSAGRTRAEATPAGSGDTDQGG